MRVGTDAMGWMLAAASTLMGLSLAPGAHVDRTPRTRGAATRVDTPRREPAPPHDSVWMIAPFRASRNPPAQRYSATAVAERPDSTEALGRPDWRLAGIVRGSELLALFEGIAGGGNGTRLVREGDEIDGYVIRAVRQDTVFVGTADAEWTFVLESPWG